ncbi:MAG: hypothetical protein Q8R44_00620 [Novosphingobium sp.]|nr:hypothetical protein [Novosphingobium sp.]
MPNSFTIVLIAQAVVVVAGVWLIFSGIVALIRPVLATTFIARMGSTVRIHWTEHTVRALAGAGLILASPAAWAPGLFLYGGVFLIATSSLILAAPRSWHARYSQTAARHLTPGLVRLLAPLAMIGGTALIWATRPGSAF